MQNSARNKPPDQSSRVKTPSKQTEEPKTVTGTKLSTNRPGSANRPSSATKSAQKGIEPKKVTSLRPSSAQRPLKNSDRPGSARK